MRGGGIHKSSQCRDEYLSSGSNSGGMRVSPIDLYDLLPTETSDFVGHPLPETGILSKRLVIIATPGVNLRNWNLSDRMVAERGFEGLGVLLVNYKDLAGAVEDQVMHTSRCNTNDIVETFDDRRELLLVAVVAVFNIILLLLSCFEPKLAGHITPVCEDLATIRPHPFLQFSLTIADELNL